MKKESLFMVFALILFIFLGCNNSNPEVSQTYDEREDITDVTTEVTEKASTEYTLSYAPTGIPESVDNAIRFWADHFGELIYSDYEMDPNKSDSHEVSLVDYDGDLVPELITRYINDSGDIWRYYDLNSNMTDYSVSTAFDETGIELFDPYYKVSLFETDNGERSFVFRSYTFSEIDTFKYQEERGYIEVKFEDGILLENIKNYTGVSSETDDQEWTLSNVKYFTRDGNETDERTYNSTYVGDVIFPDEDYRVYDVHIDYETILGSDQYKSNYVYSVLVNTYDKFFIDEANNLNVRYILDGTWSLDEESSEYEWALDKGFTTLVFEEDMVKTGEENQINYFIDYESYSGDIIPWCVKTSGIFGQSDVTYKINSYSNSLSVWMVVKDNDGELRYVTLSYEKN
ncbi:MAG: hypothetical protein MJ172_08990 [Clostridia bacterium]|nr:hypothetical protein [Clostridia bacterium]